MGKSAEKFDVSVEVYEPLALDEADRLVAAGRTVCKFVLVKQDGLVTLVCGPVKEYTYHAMLLDRFCRDHEIPSSWVKNRELLEVYDSGVAVRGGGWLEIRPEEGRIRIFGVSTAYGAFHRPTLEKLLQRQSALSDFTISIEQ